MAETIVKLLYYEKVINRTNDYYTLLQIPLIHSSFVARVVFYYFNQLCMIHSFSHLRYDELGGDT